MIKAAIDIGSNTCLLLVAELDHSNRIKKVLREEQRIPRLGRGVDAHGRLNQESISKLFQALTEYATIISSFGDKLQVLVTATSAVRDASNGKELVSEIHQRFGWKLNILPGWLEAEITFTGALSRLNSIPNDENVFVIDIGGGSTEVILGSKKSGIVKKISLNAGCVRYTERFGGRDIKEQKEQIFSELKSLLPSDFLNTGVQTMVGVAGTLTSLAAMEIDLTAWDAEKVNGMTFEIDQLNERVNRYLNLTPERLLETFPSVMNGRSDIFHAGLHIISGLFQILSMQNLVISVGGMREGTLLKEELLKNIG